MAPSDDRARLRIRGLSTPPFSTTDCIRMTNSEDESHPHASGSSAGDSDLDPKNVDYHELARRGATEEMETFLNAGLDPDLTNQEGHPLILIAAYNDQPAMVSLLAEHGADPNQTVRGGNTPLMGCCFKGFTEAAEALIEAGADVNAVSDSGATALTYAAMYNEPEIIDLLLEHSADPTMTDAEGQTAADRAAEQGHEELAARLESATSEA